MNITAYHNFSESLALSHSASDWPGWEKVYRKAFPSMKIMCDHRQDGIHQRQGIDRSITLSNTNQIFVDEKVRFRNKKTNKIYEDILLESLSDEARASPGWAVKELRADYIAYLIAPLGKCYLLPVIQMQLAWRKYGEEWSQKAYPVRAYNKSGNREWTTVSVPVQPRDLYRAMLEFFRIECDVWDPDCDQWDRLDTETLD